MVANFRTSVVCCVCVAVLFSGAVGPVAANSVDFVVHVSADGLNAGLLKDLVDTDIAGDYANFQRLVDEGATTFNARTDNTHTDTLPNHTSMLTGRPVLQPAGQPNTVHHGYTNNGSPAAGDTLHNQGNPNLSYVASVFDVAHDHGLSTALYASKSKFVIFEQSYNAANGAPDTTGADDGTDKIDVYVRSAPATMHASFLTDMATNHFNYSFVHYRDPDSAGHADGWGSTGWDNAVKDVDGYLGDIFDLIEMDPLLVGHTAVIFSADHGGTGTGHGDETDPSNYTVPFFVWGAGVASGADLYDLNAATRGDPGALRPDYNALVQPIRNGDGANLALELLGLGPIPGSAINAGQSLNVVPLPPAVWMALPALVVAVLLVKWSSRRGT